MPAHEEFRREWEIAGYGGDAGSAIACRPPSDPNFRRVYHLSTAEHAISNVIQQRLKLSRFSDLNDPFELLCLRLRDRRTRRLAEALRNNLNLQSGLLCFSADWREPVLWSHYAEKHRGICLGFDVPKSSVEEVRYLSDRPVEQLLPLDVTTSNESIRSKLLTSKSDGWKYEREWRRIVPLGDSVEDGDLRFVPFGTNLRLAEVILGHSCTHKVAIVRKAVNSVAPAAVTFQARLAFNFFKIVPRETTIP